VALIAIQRSQQAAQAAASHALIESTIQAGLSWKLSSTLSVGELVSSRAAELAGKEIITMAATTKASLALGLAVGGILVGVGGFGLLKGPQGGHVQAAGITTTLSNITSMGHQIELAGFTADPSQDPAEVNAEESKLSSQLPAQIQSNATTPPTEAGTPDKPKPSPLQIELDRLAKNHRNLPEFKWDYRVRSPRALRTELKLLLDAEVDFVDIPLHDAIDYLKSTFEVDIQFDNRAFNDEGISPDTFVTLSVSGVPLKTTLRMLLEPINLDYVIKNDTLTITTVTAAECYMETRLYDVQRTGVKSRKSLIETIVNTIKGEHIRWNTSNLQRIEETKDIQTSDGEGGIIQPLENSLVIYQTQRAHEDIVNLLNQLERYEMEARKAKK
jgi:hypothetical protein